MKPNGFRAQAARHNKKTFVYEFLLNRLLSARYRFGDKLLVKEISEETGVSRQPIMAALYGLQERGFVIITAQVGCEVVNPTKSEIEDFFRLFALAEGLIAELAAERCSKDDIRWLRDINERISRLEPKATSVTEDYRRLNGEFHEQLQIIARSPIVSQRQLVNFELADFFVVQTSGFEAHLADAQDEHERIIEALEAGYPKRAARAAQAHIDGVATAVSAAAEHGSASTQGHAGVG